MSSQYTTMKVAESRRSELLNTETTYSSITRISTSRLCCAAASLRCRLRAVCRSVTACTSAAACRRSSSSEVSFWSAFRLAFGAEDEVPADSPVASPSSRAAASRFLRGPRLCWPRLHSVGHSHIKPRRLHCLGRRDQYGRFEGVISKKALTCTSDPPARAVAVRILSFARGRTSKP